MGWAVGYDRNWNRHIGYGVPSACDHPDCDKEIDRGLGYVCGGDMYGGEHGCGLFFCGSHLYYVNNPNLPSDDQWSPQLCERCAEGFMLLDPNGEHPLGSTAQVVPPEPGEAHLTLLEPFAPKPDLERWNIHIMNCPSWQAWRSKNPEFVTAHKELVDPDYDKS